MQIHLIIFLKHNLKKAKKWKLGGITICNEGVTFYIDKDRSESVSDSEMGRLMMFDDEEEAKEVFNDLKNKPYFDSSFGFNFCPSCGKKVVRQVDPLHNILDPISIASITNVR